MERVRSLGPSSRRSFAQRGADLALDRPKERPHPDRIQVGPYMNAGDIRSLEEWEVGGETEFFGDIAHRMSSYAVRVDGAEELAERGMMSFQLMRIQDEWKVHSLTWQAEPAADSDMSDEER